MLERRYEYEKNNSPIGQLECSIIAPISLEGGSVNRCFQVGKVSRKARCGKTGRRRRPISTARGNREIAIFPQPSFRDSPFLYPVFAIITGVLKHLFTEPPSTRSIIPGTHCAVPLCFLPYLYYTTLLLRVP